jgi:hypothetical protein
MYKTKSLLITSLLVQKHNRFLRVTVTSNEITILCPSLLISAHVCHQKSNSSRDLFPLRGHVNSNHSIFYKLHTCTPIRGLLRDVVYLG